MPLMIKLNRNIMKVDLCLDNGHFITVFIFTGMTKLFPSASQVLMISLLAASGPSASTVTQFAQLYDNHAFESSVINALSILLCIITMPIINIIYTFLL